MPEICAVIFDMDGLMLDTEPRYREAWMRAAAECGFYLADEVYCGVIGRTRTEGEQILREHFGPPFPLDRFRTACERFEKIALESTPLPKKPGLDELLEMLASRDIPMAVATSTTRDTAVAQLEATGLLRRFRTIATGDEIVNGKPAPDLFLLAARRLNTDPANCLVLEDSAAGVAAAHAAGMPVYMVPDLIPPSTETRQLATAVFSSLEDAVERIRDFSAQAAERGSIVTRNSSAASRAERVRCALKFMESRVPAEENETRLKSRVPALSEIREPVRHPGGGKQHIEEPGASVHGLAPRVISRIQPESPEHADRNHEPVIKRREHHERRPASGHTGDQHD